MGRLAAVDRQYGGGWQAVRRHLAAHTEDSKQVDGTELRS